MTRVLKGYFHKDNKKKDKSKLYHLFVSGGEGEQKAKEINALVPKIHFVWFIS